MNCPRCGKSNIAGAAFCMHCGQDLRVSNAQNNPNQPQNVLPQNVRPQHVTGQQRPIYAPQPGIQQPGNPGGAGQPVGQVFQDARKKQDKLVWITVGVLLLVALGIAVAVGTANLVSAFGRERPAPNINKLARAPGSPSLVREAKAPDQPSLTVQKSLKKMPDDVRAWLEHLAETERRRGQLSNRNMGQVMALMPTAGLGIDVQGVKDMTDPDVNVPHTQADTLKENGDQVRAEWEQLMQFYVSVQPPQECMDVANTYHHAIQETGAMIGDILDSLAKSKEDPKAALQALYAMQNTSKTIDQYGKDTDYGVQVICDKYDTRKWFSVNADYGNSNVFGAFGSR